MKKRGRKSAAELAVAPVVTVAPRPVAPVHMTDDEAGVWEAAVATMEATYFRPSDFDTLANLCRHAVSARRISRWIEEAIGDEDTDLETLDRLHRMRERETRAATAMARTLRLTKQAQIGAKNAASRVSPPGTKPWE